MERPLLAEAGIRQSAHVSWMRPLEIWRELLENLDWYEAVFQRFRILLQLSGQQRLKR
jgi:hypothetical protein